MPAALRYDIIIYKQTKNTKKVLVREGLMKEEVVQAEDCIFDFDNRDRMGGNGYDAHKNGNIFMSFGADPDELKKALAIQVCPFNPVRELEYAKMEGIVRLSDGLLANVSHREDSSTLACGHFAQFIKAVKAGCKTPFDKLQDSDGNLNMSTLSARDDNMRPFCTKGWLQKKMPFAVRAAWPWVPHLAQGAPNATAAIIDGQTFSFAELDRAGTAVAHEILGAGFPLISEQNCADLFTIVIR